MTPIWAQGVHSVLPAGAHVPSSHAEHTLGPGRALYEPVAHSWQGAALLLLSEAVQPGWQEQSVAEAAPYSVVMEPGGHASHAPTAPGLGE
jgi:hypothetical protein